MLRCFNVGVKNIVKIVVAIKGLVVCTVTVVIADSPILGQLIDFIIISEQLVVWSF